MTSFATAQAIVTETTRPATTAPVTVSQTETTVGKLFNYVAAYSGNCVPCNHLNLYLDVANVPLAHEGIFQWCAAKCASDVKYTQIWVAYDDPIAQSGLWCMTGGPASTSQQL